MADRAKISDRATVGLLAATLKSFKTVDDEDMNLNDFTLSRTTAQRKKQDMKEMKKIKKVEERKKKMREANSNPLEGLDSLFQPPMKEVSHFNNLTSRDLACFTCKKCNTEFPTPALKSLHMCNSLLYGPPVRDRK